METLNPTNNQWDNIPQELRDLPQWVGWQRVPNGNRVDKVPYDPKSDNRKASTTDPSTWGTFQQAIDSVGWPGNDGVGFVFTEQDEYCGVDLDHCLSGDPGLTIQIVELFSSYCEVSPSGDGLHIIIKGKLPPGAKTRFTLETGQGVEVYDRARFFTFTGSVWGVDHAD